MAWSSAPASPLHRPDCSSCFEEERERLIHDPGVKSFLESSEMMLRERNHLSATSATYPPPRAPRAPALFCLPRGNTSHHSSAARSSFLSSSSSASSASSGGLFGGVERAWAADGQGQRARARDSTFDTSRDGKRRRRENAVPAPHKRLRTGRERRTGLEHQWRDGDG